MILIAFEGIDGSGKSTQAELLYNRLSGNGYRCIFQSFPNKDSPFGDMIYRWLNGSIEVSDHRIIDLLHSGDKYQFQEKLKDSDVDVVILDRYILSQYVYSYVNKIDVKWLKRLQESMRQPDITILIDLDVDESARRIEPSSKDRYEGDLRFLTEVRNQYLKQSLKIEGCCWIYNGIQSIDELHSQIYEDVIEAIGDDA